MPYPESLLARLAGLLESLADYITRNVADGIDQAEAAHISSQVATGAQLAAVCEGAQRAGYHLQRTGDLPRDYAREHPDVAEALRKVADTDLATLGLLIRDIETAPPPPAKQP